MENHKNHKNAKIYQNSENGTMPKVAQMLKMPERHYGGEGWLYSGQLFE